MNFYEQIFNRGRATGEGMTHFERLFAAKFGGSPPPEVREYTGAVPVTITADGTPLLDYLITGNTVQNGAPTPENPIMPEGCGNLEATGEHAGQYKIPISSANTSTPVYLGEVETTRKIKKYEFTGQEDWRLSTTSPNVFWINNFESDYDNSLFGIISCKCSHYLSVANQTGLQGLSNFDVCLYCYNSIATNYHELYLKDDRYSSITGFKTYLAQQYAAGTPVTVWYVLASETTGIVNEPLMKIGDYADTLSKAQAGVTIPTNNGSTTVDVDTDVKPSEVYIKYMG